MLKFGLNETIDQFPMPNRVHWYGHVLRIEDGQILEKALELQTEGQRRKLETGGKGLKHPTSCCKGW